jgi:excisionase family DNA binding protein
MDEGKILLGRKESAALLSISLRTLDSLLSRREIVARRIGRRLLISRTELERFARRDHDTQPEGPSR